MPHVECSQQSTHVSRPKGQIELYMPHLVWSTASNLTITKCALVQHSQPEILGEARLESLTNAFQDDLISRHNVKDLAPVSLLLGMYSSGLLTGHILTKTRVPSSSPSRFPADIASTMETCHCARHHFRPSDTTGRVCTQQLCNHQPEADHPFHSMDWSQWRL